MPNSSTGHDHDQSHGHPNRRDDLGADRSAHGDSGSDSARAAHNSFGADAKQADEREDKVEQDATAVAKPIGKSNRGFAAMAPEERRAIASRGGQSQGKGNNPGNFANNRERAREAGRKGGQH